MKDIRDQIIEAQEKMIIVLSTESINKERFDMIVGLGKEISSLKSQLSKQEDSFKKCPDWTCNLKVFCKRFDGSFPYAKIWHGEDEDGIHYCNHILRKENPQT